MIYQETRAKVTVKARQCRDVRIGPEMGQIGSKLETPEIFKDQISVNFVSAIYDLKSLMLGKLGANLTHFVNKSGIPDSPALTLCTSSSARRGRGWCRCRRRSSSEFNSSHWGQRSS